MTGEKTGGRTSGTPNKKSKILSELLLEKFPEYHPVLAMAAIANDEKQDINIRFHAHKEVAKYICPQLKSITINPEFEKLTRPPTQVIFQNPYCRKGNCEENHTT